MSYERVLPRDLFNEAKLLKCLGRLALLIHDEKLPRLRFEQLETNNLRVELDVAFSELFCPALCLHHGETELELFTPYNNREEYPLYFRVSNEDGIYEGRVFNNDGSVSADLANWLDANKAAEVRD